MIRIGSEVLLVGGVRERLLEKEPVVELVVDFSLQVVQGEMEPQMTHKDGEKQCVLYNICHEPCLEEPLGGNDNGGVPL